MLVEVLEVNEVDRESKSLALGVKIAQRLLAPWHIESMSQFNTVASTMDNKSTKDSRNRIDT